MTDSYGRVNNLTNKECVGYVRRKRNFSNKGGTLWSTDYYNGGCRYCVFSYGPHWPLYIWVKDVEKWYGNKDKYSLTTTRHASLVRPSSNITWLSVKQMRVLYDKGYSALVKDRILATV